MQSHKIVWQETKAVALGQLICCIAMLDIYSLIGRFTQSAVLGVLVGGLLATANFFVMALCADIAADKGARQDVRGGQSLVTMSYLGRMAVLFVILALCAKSGCFDLIGLVLPLVFVRPILTVKELIHKKGVDPK